MDINAKQFLKILFEQSLENCSPKQVISKSIQRNSHSDKVYVGGRWHSIEERPVFVLAVGKAAVPMYEAAAGILKENIIQSLVIIPDEEQAKSCAADEILTGAHPVPDERSLEAGRKAMEFVKAIPEEALLITLISGGTSSLMCLPAEGITIGDLNRTFELLNKSGATIRQINTVRKHCSRLKGGQLLRYLDPRTTLVDLVISDVPDDDLSIIGSGPTIADASTFRDACEVLQEFELWEKIPKSVRSHIEKGLNDTVPETMKPGKDPLKEHHSYIVSSAKKLAENIRDLAREEGCQPWVSDQAFNKDVQEVADYISDLVLRLNKDTDKPGKRLFVFYGESTVAVSGTGKGGRNQELALRGALKIEGQAGISWLSAGTDGIDGPTDAAGAIVDGATISQARKKGIDPEKYLAENDSYHFHRQMGTLFKTGPTGNNLMDVVLVLVE